MAYAILRAAKLKTMGAIAGSLAHTYRERETPDADPARLERNEHLHNNKQEALAAIQRHLPERRRSNAVLAIEYFIGASPEFFKENSGDAYFTDALTWLRERHGPANVISASIHRDETSPHLVVYVVPLDEAGRLNARRYLGGKVALSKMQTEFAEKVGQQHGLQRGIQGSKAKHTSVKAYYGALEAGEKEHPHLHDLTPQVKRKGLFGSRLGQKLESSEETSHRVREAVKNKYEPAILEASTARLQARRAKEMELTARSKQEALEALQGRLKGLGGSLRGLTSKQISTLARLIDRWQRKNLELPTEAAKKGREMER